MALLDTQGVVASVAALFDDPEQSQIDQDYVLPFLNLRWANLCVNLVSLGLQYEEVTALMPAMPPGTADLSAYMAAGQPLSTMLSPKTVEWKPASSDPTNYLPATRVAEVDDVPQGYTAVDDWAWIGGTLYLTPVGVPVDLRIRFNAMSTTLVDPTDQIIVGIGDVLAYRVAELLWMLRGAADLRGTMSAKMKELGDQAFDDFCAMSTMAAQANRINVLPTHARRSWGIFNR